MTKKREPFYKYICSKDYCIKDNLYYIQMADIYRFSNRQLILVHQ